MLISFTVLGLVLSIFVPLQLPLPLPEPRASRLLKMETVSNEQILCCLILFLLCDLVIGISVAGSLILLLRPKAAAIPELEGTPIDGAAAVTVAATAAAAAAAGDGSSSSFKGMRGDVARSSGS